ncbi:MAG: tetratricopeptide repeat protein [Acidobacteriota bacterium]
MLPAAELMAQDWKGRGRVQGKVTDEAGEPVKDATVYITYGADGSGPEPVKTKKNGRWAYMGLTSGSFSIRVEAEGYVGAEGEMRVNEYTPAANKPLETTLRKDTAKAVAAEGDRLMTVLNEGNQLLMDGQFAEARQRFEEVRSKVKDKAQKTQLDRAIAGTFLEEGQTAEARARYEALLAEETDVAVRTADLQAIARSYYKEENVDASVATLEKALAAAPEDPGTLRLVVDILLASGREADAEPYMARLPQGEKIDPNAMLNLGITAYNGGDMDKALEKFQQVVGAYPDNANAHYYLGLTFMGKLQNDQAKSHFDKMLELEPEHPSAGEAKQFLEYLATQ